MRDETEILQSFARLRRETLYMWIERGWLTPQKSQNEYRFHEIDVARIRLIHEFHYELDLDEEAMDVILPLLDQVHGLRHELRRLAHAVNAQPEDIRTRIAAVLSETT
jgi:chaperone modulatory protein CbpM